MKTTFTILMLLLLTAGPAPAQDQSGDEFTSAGESGAALPEMVVEAENEVRQEIEKGTFEFDLDAAAVDSFFTAMDEEVLGVSPVSGLQPHLNNLEKLTSDQPPHFWIPEMATTPVATFYPTDPEGHKVKEWSLSVTDFRGSPFRTFSGGGEAPERLDWDGLGDNSEMLQVGYPYSYVFTVTDKGTNTYNHAGVSFRIPALDYRQDGDRVLEIAGGQLFVRNETKLTGQRREVAGSGQRRDPAPSLLAGPRDRDRRNHGPGRRTRRPRGHLPGLGAHPAAGTGGNRVRCRRPTSRRRWTVRWRWSSNT